MNIKILAILVLLLGSDHGLGRNTVLAFSIVKQTLPPLITKAFSVGNQFSHFIGDKFSSMYNNIRDRFYEARSKVLQIENDLMTGASISLSELESKVNDMFMKHKTDELNWGQNHTDFHAPGLHFFKGKPLIEKSKVFRFLRKMPKGAILHIHSTASVSSDWVVRNMSHIPGLLRCTNKNGLSILSFRKSESVHKCSSSYIEVSKERRSAVNSVTYDRYFEKLINLYTPNPESDYTSIDTVWTKFQNMFATISDAIYYIDAFRAYNWQMLQEMYDDNIMYAEVRSGFLEVWNILAVMMCSKTDQPHKLYDKDGTTYSMERTVMETIDVVTKFREEHPKFLGIKLIMSTHRLKASQQIEQDIQKFQKLQSKFPEFLVGFDLVGQEDKGKPLQNFLETILQSPRPTYFFHAGETNNFGASADLNLVDAILLNTKRIGHGYMLMKHPLLRQMVKARQIAVEVCPISNQVLHLTADLRNHPGGIFISEDIPMVISNDDPGFWNARGLSYDFYYAIMSFAPKQSGLRMLKTLALNSLKFSTFNNFEINNALSRWDRDWRNFLNDVLNGKVF